ncbi:copper resistance system multicopper oxidase [Caulobacter sp. 17J65-9]|uniref:copper resistance system multicopper oxidase n=1 Tax=Caulobacter sp. 17J65-9 TaxID=2709382 RepID=UPI0013C655D8|nr:copper resistance system multicopper oxidase [Caulobacter sp. 17J65-9]NEX91242.1 copper resistance system multicopper oxidase [Caulobacter sp. 17J65-9]
MRRTRLLLATCAALALAPAAFAAEYDLVIDKRTVTITGEPSEAITVNGQVPGPTLRLREGETATIRVTNRLDEETSVHWHGLLLDGKVDGVPGFNGFQGIKPGETYTYTFPVIQSGTYWYHAHSVTQEQAGHYGSIVIDPAEGPKIKTDRDYVVVFSEFTREDPERILRNLKVDPGYYNYRKRTVGDFFRDAKKFGLGAAIKDRKAWGSMRMDPTDIADVAKYTFLVNGKAPESNETLIFRPGEKVRLRFINASAMTYFDVRIPGLKMTVVAADGRDVEPVPVDEFRLAVAETYDVIVEPETEQAFTVFAESIDRSGYARATLAPREGMTGEIPAIRPRALLTMSEMGHGMSGMDHGGMDHSAMGHDAAAPAGDMQGMDHAAMGHGSGAPAASGHEGMDHSAMGHGAAAPADDMQGMDHAAMGHGDPSDALATDYPKVDYGMGRPGMDHGMGELAPEGTLDGAGNVMGWSSGAPWGAKVLSYADLRSAEPQKDIRAPEREIVVRLGGNMERYIWTLNGKKYGEAEPIQLRYGERVRMTFINETMMAHPMHLHGMFVQLENGQPAERLPDKHVVSVAPGRSYSVLISADAAGEWAFHCHLLYHMESGMMQKVVVARLGETPPQPDAAPEHGGHDHAHGAAQ